MPEHIVTVSFRVKGQPTAADAENLVRSGVSVRLREIQLGVSHAEDIPLRVRSVLTREEQALESVRGCHDDGPYDEGNPFL